MTDVACFQHELEFYARHFNCIELNTTFYSFVPSRGEQPTGFKGSESPKPTTLNRANLCSEMLASCSWTQGKTRARNVAAAVYESWAQRAARFGHDGRFEYVVKAWKYFTHMKRLRIDDDFRRNWDKIWVRTSSCPLMACQRSMQ